MNSKILCRIAHAFLRGVQINAHWTSRELVHAQDVNQAFPQRRFSRASSSDESYAVATEATEAPEAQETIEKDNVILALIQERKTTAKHEKERIREICKKIKNCIRDIKRRTRQEKIQKILEELKGTRNISSIKSAKKRILIPKVKNKEGEMIKTRLHLGLSARALLRLYAQDPVARVFCLVVCFSFPLSLCGSLPRCTCFKGCLSS